MSRLIRDMIISIGALASLVGLVFAVRPRGAPWSPLDIFLLVLALLLGCVSVYLDVVKYQSRQVRVFKGQRAIRDYMYQWINNAGGVAIFTRDLSWVNDDEVETLLKAKAKKGDLTLVLPRPIKLSRQLETSGASVLYYPTIDYVIKSRFTVINTGRADTRVAIGRTEGTKHFVEEFSAGDHPAFYLADDMLQIMNKFCTKERP
jgi:hypothetical protein